MRKLTLILFVALLPLPALGVNRMIRAGATGTVGTTGCDTWESARACPAPSFARGDVNYVAGGGTYASFDVTTAVSGTTLITIKGATASDHGTDTGWQASFGVDVAPAVFGFGASIQTSYVVFDGQVGSGNTLSSYGFNIARPSNCNTAGSYFFVGIINASSVTTDVTVKHIGVDSCGPSFNVQQYAFQFGCGACHVTNSTLANNYATGAGVTFALTNLANSTIEHNWSENQWSSPANHGETLLITNCHNSDFSGCSTAFTQGLGSINVTFRYNVIKNCRGTACMAGLDPGNPSSAPDWKVYGNVFVDATEGNGVIATGTSATHYLKGWEVYNNTFINCPKPIFVPCVDACGGSTGNVFRNNLLYGSVSNISGGTITISHNSYFDRTNVPPAQTGLQDAAGCPFLNCTTVNFDPRPTNGTTISDWTVLASPFASAPAAFPTTGTTVVRISTSERGAYIFDISSVTVHQILSGRVTLIGNIKIVH